MGSSGGIECPSGGDLFFKKRWYAIRGGRSCMEREAASGCFLGPNNKDGARNFLLSAMEP